jgi:hypothetical protein
MSNPRERVLKETIKNFLMGIHNSEEIHKEYSKLGKKIVRMGQREIDRIAAIVASNVENYVIAFEKRNKRPPSHQAIMKKIAQELENI